MDVTLYYPDGTSNEDINNDVTTSVATRSVQISDDEWQAVQEEYGVNTSLSNFEDQIQDAESFNVDSGAAAGARAGLFVAVLAVISAAILV